MQSLSSEGMLLINVNSCEEIGNRKPYHGSSKEIVIAAQNNLKLIERKNNKQSPSDLLQYSIDQNNVSLLEPDE